jgi:hypothetical protein
VRSLISARELLLLKPENPIFPEESIPPKEMENLIVGKFKWVFWKAK